MYDRWKEKIVNLFDYIYGFYCDDWLSVVNEWMK